MLRTVLALAGVTAALGVPAAHARPSATKPVTKIMGTMRVHTAPSGHLWSATYKGRLPALKAHEYMHFWLYGPQKSQCSYFGNGSGRDGKPRMKTDTSISGLATPTGFPDWCRGKWIGMYQVMTPFRSNGRRAWRVRMTIAIVNFRY